MMVSVAMYHHTIARHPTSELTQMIFSSRKHISARLSLVLCQDATKSTRNCVSYSWSSAGNSWPLIRFTVKTLLRLTAFKTPSVIFSYSISNILAEILISMVGAQFWADWPQFFFCPSIITYILGWYTALPLNPDV